METFTVINNLCWHAKRLCGSVILQHFIRQWHRYMMTQLRSNHCRPGNCISHFLSLQSFLTGFTAVWYRSQRGLGHCIAQRHKHISVWDQMFAWSISGAAEEQRTREYAQPKGILLCWMELRNATVDKRAASYETTAIHLKPTLRVSALQHKREVNPRYQRRQKGRRDGKRERKEGEKKQTLQGCLTSAQRGFQCNLTAVLNTEHSV